MCVQQLLKLVCTSVDPDESLLSQVALLLLRRVIELDNGIFNRYKGC